MTRASDTPHRPAVAPHGAPVAAVQQPSLPDRRAAEGFRRLAPHPLVGAALAYLVGALLLGHRVLADLNSVTIGWISADSHTFAWWLQWLPVAAERGINPLVLDYVHHPYGINAMWNIPVPVIALLMWPVTELVGPVAAYNVAMILGPVVSGVAMAAALVPWTRTWTARVLGGGLYAFSPFMVAHFSVGHLNLVWAVFPPVLLALVRVLLVDTPRSPVRVGALFGIALAVQTGLYTQTLALGALVLVLTGLVVSASWPRAVPGRLPVIGRAAAAGLVTYSVLCAYPLYLVLFGPVRPEGMLRPALEVRADPLNAVVPTSLTRLGGGSETARQMNHYTGEQGGYLGVAVLLAAVVTLVVVRSAVPRVVAAVGLLTFLFSLGPSLTSRGTDLGVWLPWRLLENVPLLSQAEPVRLQVFVAACAAMLVALLVDHLGHLRTRARVVLASVLVASAVASWFPARPAETADARSPDFFRTAGEQLQTTDVVVSYPRPSARWVGGALPILWQAHSRMAYRTTGGSFLSSDPDHPFLMETPENLYEGASRGLLAGLPPPDDGYVTATRRELRGLGVTALLVVPQPGEDYARVLDFTERVAGGPPETYGEVRLYRLEGP